MDGSCNRKSNGNNAWIVAESKRGGFGTLQKITSQHS